MPSLTTATICIAVPHLILGVMALARPDTLREGLLKLPRNKPFYIGLTVINLAWITYLTLTNTLPFPVLEQNKQLILIITPVLAWAIPRYLHELLGARALGGFLLLACVPVFEAGFLKPSLLKLVITTTAYGWVLVGMLLVIHPFRFHRSLRWIGASLGRWRIVAVLTLIYSASLIALLLTGAGSLSPGN